MGFILPPNTFILTAPGTGHRFALAVITMPVIGLAIPGVFHYSGSEWLNLDIGQNKQWAVLKKEIDEMGITAWLEKYIAKANALIRKFLGVSLPELPPTPPLMILSASDLDRFLQSSIDGFVGEDGIPQFKVRV